jgi:exonuclease VII small subunit
MLEMENYEKAAERLQELLHEMEHGEPGPDRIEAILQEARELVSISLERINGLRLHVESLRKQMDENT